MNLAIHNLLQDKLRFVLSATGVALAVMLILLLLGLREGTFQSAVVHPHGGSVGDTCRKSKDGRRKGAPDDTDV